MEWPVEWRRANKDRASHARRKRLLTPFRHGPKRDCRKMIFPVCLSCYAWGLNGLFCPTSACPSADKVVDRLLHSLGGRRGIFNITPVGLSYSHLPRIAGVSVVAA